MNNPNFKIGDVVDYKGSTGAITQLDVICKDQKLGATVEWQANLTPPQSNVPYEDLVFVGSPVTLQNSNSKVYKPGQDPWTYSQAYSNTKTSNINTHCPVCSSEWEDRTLVYSSFKYCPKCKEEKDFLVEQAGVVGIDGGKNVYSAGAD